MTDQEIVNKLKEGKQDRALLALYKFYPSIEYFLRTNGASKEEALDVYQDALYILCKKAKEENFQLSAQLNTYLFSVSKYIWKASLLKKNRTVSFTIEAHEVVDESLIIEEEKASVAEKALANIGDKCVEILKAFYHEKLNMTKIAELFNFSSEKSARNQKYKCLEKAKLEYSEMSKNR